MNKSSMKWIFWIGGACGTSVAAPYLTGRQPWIDLLVASLTAMVTLRVLYRTACSPSERQQAEEVEDVSHEMRNLMTVVTNRVEAIKDQVIPATPEELGLLYEEMLRFTRLIEDLENPISKQRGNELLTSRVDLCCIVKTSIYEVALLAGRRNIELNRGEQLAEAVWVEADEARIVQVIHNLLLNALEHTSDEGTVSVSIHVLRGGEAQVTVTDQGKGVAFAAQELLFKRKHRLAANQGQSRGIGLWIVKLIVEQHGGRVWVNSTPGEGSAFSFTLPLAQVPNQD